LKKLGWIALVLAVTACGHKQHSQAEAESGSASMPQPANTGQTVPVYPRAQLVALPGAASSIPSTPSALDQNAPATTNAATASVPPGEAATPSSPDSSAGNPGATTNSDVTAAPPAGAPPAAPDTSAQAAQVVVLQTSFGRIVLELDDFAAPKTCDNFRTLVAAGFYNGTIFHRVIPQFVIQGGDPNTKTDNRITYGQGDPGYTLPPEIKLHHDRGAVAMARLPDAVNPQRDSNGSQFYICLVPCPSLDDQYTVLAHVILGMDVAERIAGAPRDSRDDPLERIAMDARLEPRDQALQEGSTVNH
jgi:peptidyl-prolyl cis-trans isomerase B (cyclophilin B)